MPHLFDAYTLRSVTFRNRIGMSPMCQYSSVDGFPNAWHDVHLASRAVGGVGVVIVEATGVEPRGRITPWDAGIWSDALGEAWGKVAKLIESFGAVPAIQLAHAGRKASTRKPWEGGKALPADEGGWQVIAPSDAAFSDTYPQPVAMTRKDLDDVRDAFVAAAKRAVAGGYKLIEVHAAHGYLLHSFLSPLSNRRTDEYGGSFDNRVRYVLEVTRAVRGAVPDDLPLVVRLSCSDWAEGGWTIEESIELSRRLKSEGVDLIDCSSGGLTPKQKIEIGPGYQVPFADAIRREAGIPTAAVGLITNAPLADAIIRNGRADMAFVARALLRDPYWALHAAKELGVLSQLPAPVQYERAF